MGNTTSRAGQADQARHRTRGASDADGPRRARARSAVSAALLALGLLLGALLPASAVAGEICPNAAERFGPSALLPDCRAYELVTPPNKEDNSTIKEIHGFSDGEHVYYRSVLPLPGAQTGQESGALSTRTPEGWVTTPLTTPSGPGEPVGFGHAISLRTAELPLPVSFTSDFSAAFVNSPLQYGALDQNKQWNTFRIDIPSGAASIESLPEGGPMTEALIDPPDVESAAVGLPEGAYVPGAFLAGSSANGSQVYFETSVQLPTASGTPADTHTTSNELYERREGHTYLVGVLPDGSVPACGVEIGSTGYTQMNEGAFFSGYPSEYGDIAANGENVVFYSPGQHSACSEPKKTYLREDNGKPEAKTVELPSGTTFLARTADQQELLLTGENNELLEYDIPSGQTTVVGHGSLLATSSDGSRVYSTSGAGAGEMVSLYEDGTIEQVPIPAAGVQGELLSNARAFNRPATTPDGSKLVFVDRENLTSYNSTGHNEVYTYEAASNAIRCISCNPDGSSPLRNSGLLTGEKPEAFENYSGTNIYAHFAASEDPMIDNEYPAISSDGEQVFFGSQEGLVPQDTNGLEDVYEWEQAGTGSCGTSNSSYSAVSGGCVYLISSGAGSNGSWLVGASEDGSNVFIMTDDSLAPQVDESAQEIYDARVDGGFPYTTPTYGCDSGQCQGPQGTAPTFAPPPSATFVGLGNPVSEEASVATAKSKKKQSAKPKRSKKKRRAKRTGKHKVKQGRVAGGNKGRQ